jgi:GT2 family glycosyltransferase
VVVCSYNGAQKLPTCLEALARQYLSVDVLVVDDGSTDGTSDVAQSFGCTVVRHENNKGISAARNTGLTHATSTIVAFCDDDCVPPVDWTERLLAAWRSNPDVTILGGTIEVDSPTTFTEGYLTFNNPLVPIEIEIAQNPSVWYRILRQFRPPRLPTDEVFRVDAVVGANMSMHRDRALEAGGFDEGLKFGEGEEASICTAVRARFGESSVVVDPQVELAHRFDTSMIKVWRRSFVYGQGAAERWKKQSGLPALPVVGPLAIVVAVVVAPFSWPVGLLLGLGILSTPTVVWASRSRSRRHPAVLAYPLVALADDLAKILGFVRSALRGREYRRRKKVVLPLVAAIALFAFTPISGALLAFVNGSFAPTPYTSLALRSPAQAATGFKRGAVVQLELANHSGRDKTYRWNVTQASTLIGTGQERLADGQTQTILVPTKFAVGGTLRVALDGTNIYVDVPIVKS